jgi:hypothetical protein
LAQQEAAVFDQNSRDADVRVHCFAYPTGIAIRCPADGILIPCIGSDHSNCLPVEGVQFGVGEVGGHGSSFGEEKSTNLLRGQGE